MLRNIEIEKTLPKDRRHEFNPWVEGALCVKKGHNCFSWSIDLKEKRMPPSVSGYVVEVVTDYTKTPNKYIETPLQWI